jgi:hypothetical protein
VAEVPRKTESLCSLVRSTVKPEAFKGTFTADPLVGVRVIVFTSTTKESTFVLFSGASGAAVSVKLRVAVPLGPQFCVHGGFGRPLQELKRAADSNGNTT